MKRGWAAVLLMAGLLIAARGSFAGEIDGKALGKLTLPDRLQAVWTGDTLRAAEQSDGHVTVTLYAAPKEAASEPSTWLRKRADEFGLPANVRAVSGDQREMARIGWGGYILGTTPRPVKPAESVEEKPSEVPESSILVGGLRTESLDAANKADREGGFTQPEGLPAVQQMVVLYVKEKRAVVMELTVWLPEGSSMELTDIQRKWHF